MACGFGAAHNHVMIRRCFFSIFLLAAALAAVSPAWAGAKEKLRQIESQLNQRKEQAETLDEKSKEAAENLKDLRQKLIAATENLEAKESEQELLDDKQDALAADIEAKETQLICEKRKLGKLVEALIAMSQQPPESLLLQTGLTADTIHRSIVLHAVMPRVREHMDSFAHDLAALNELKTELAEQQRLTASAEENLQEQQHSLDQLIKARQGLLQRTEQQKQAIAAQLVSLANEAKDLHQLMEKITPHRSPKAHAGPDSGITLKVPVSGPVIHRFGDRDADGVTSEGMTFATLSASPVVAPAAGRVVFAGPFKGYGHIVILQHDGGYHSFLAGFGRIDADMGQDVEAGEPLGVMPVQAKGRPQFYFEWRRNSEPIEPRLDVSDAK